MGRWRWMGVVMVLLAGCNGASNDPAPAAAQTKPVALRSAPAAASVKGGQRGKGLPYEVQDSQVWDVPDPVSGRDYQVFVALPPSYATQPQRRYPVLYATDADYAFPLIKQIARRLNGEGPAVDEFILVGLSYAVGEDGMSSRRRDYTPTAAGADGAQGEAVHGMGEAYITYLREQVLPFVAQRYRSDESQRLFLGHSYGALLGTQILLSEPTLFSGYILGSPSFWYGNHYMEGMESAFASSQKDLPAHVYMYVGQYEDPRYGKRNNMVADAERMARSLRSRRYPSLRLKLDVLNDEDHLSVAPRGFTHGLHYLLSLDAR